jgi:LCP family protein required for cell wall assembly
VSTDGSDRFYGKPADEPPSADGRSDAGPAPWSAQQPQSSQPPSPPLSSWQSSRPTPPETPPARPVKPPKPAKPPKPPKPLPSARPLSLQPTDRAYGGSNAGGAPPIDPGMTADDFGAAPPQPPGSRPPVSRPPIRPPRPRRRRHWVRTALYTLLALVLVFTGTVIGTWFWANGKLQKVGAIADYAGRPPQGAGTNWLIVGSDSRSNLTPQQEDEYHVGSDQGLNTDTMMLFHYGSSGPDLISIPRDSYVTIPAYTDASGVQHPASQDKINSAYSDGGVQLLIETVEMATGVRIDHYVEVGFLGVVNVVNAIGGVPMCLSAPVQDSHSGASLAAGCQVLNGTQALEYVRTRYSLPNSDISRMADQQMFIRALAKQALRPGVVFNPFSLYPFLGSTLDALAVDDGTSLWDLTQLARHFKGVVGNGGTVGTLPISDEGYEVSGLGSTVLWDKTRAQQVFTAVNQDQPIPAGLLNYLG